MILDFSLNTSKEAKIKKEIKSKFPISTPLIYLKEKLKSKECIQLKNINKYDIKVDLLTIPINKITCLTGLAGSGKSTLLEILNHSINKSIKTKQSEIKTSFGTLTIPFIFNKLVLSENIFHQHIRADVATFSKLMDEIRFLFASLKDSKILGLKPSHFSSNHPKGMCLSCYGLGYKFIDLKYLPSVKIKCDNCNGSKLNSISLQPHYNNKNISQILNFTIKEAIDFFISIPNIHKKLQTLSALGLNYLKLNKETTKLSFSELQKIKLFKDLYTNTNRKNIYLIEEPTIGLDEKDIQKIIIFLKNLQNDNHAIILTTNSPQLMNQNNGFHRINLLS